MSRARTAFSVFAAAALALPTAALAGVFVSNDGDPTTITHPAGYSGTGGVLNVTVCVDPDSDDADALDLAMPAVIATWNGLTPVSPNLFFGGDNDLAFEQYDWASVATHEIGHCLGLGHPNLASESGVAGADTDYTSADPGLNAMYNLDDGIDNVIGSSDDIRGDDVGVHWFRISNNNPFTIEPAVIDTTTYSSSLLDLPLGHLFAANASRDVGALLGASNSECVMQQGQFNDEAQRDLGHDDVATIRLAMAGVDETQGTADDYTLNLIYGGVTTSGCDIIANSGNEATFASCSLSFTSIGAGPGGNHDSLRGSGQSAPAHLEFNHDVNWYYLLPVVADLCPGSPMAGCRASASAKMQIKDQSGSEKDQVKVKLGKADATAYLDFLDPLADTAYSLCVYDSSGSSQPLMESGVAAAPTCDGAPCWKTKTGTSYQYKSKSGLLEGMKQIKLKAGAAGKAQVQTKAAGDRTSTPAPPLVLPVTAQVIASDGMTTQCWEATFSAATKNEPAKFSAKAP